MIADITVEHPRTGTAVVVLQGEHDLATQPELHDLLDSLIRENDLVVVDLSDAQFIDSSVLRNLVVADRLARSTEVTLRLQLGSSPIVRKALEISSLLNVLEWVGDREQALDLEGVVSKPDRPGNYLG